ncbi:MAG: class I SAM-dependent methyltransferase [Candidatus Hodarchaeales archaeon]|jgi:SAM-dependent methyltransferase
MTEVISQYEQYQHPLHIYNNEYWEARKQIAKRFFNQNLVNYLSKFQQIDTILDLGCGDSSFGRRVAKLCKASELWCIDINPLQLKRARKLNLKLRNTNTYEILSNLGKGPLPILKNTIDFVIMINSVYYLTNKQKLKLFKEVKRCLKPGGRFLFTIENKLYWRNTHPYFPPILGFWLSPKRITEKILINKGFSDKLPKFHLHHHTTSLSYLHLLRKANAKRITPLLNNSLEYEKPLIDHATKPFSFNNNVSGVSTTSTKSNIIDQFESYQTSYNGDNLFSKISKSLVNLNLTKLAFLFAPRITYIVQF